MPRAGSTQPKRIPAPTSLLEADKGSRAESEAGNIALQGVRGKQGWSPHGSFSSDAHTLFGNRIVHEAMQGDAVDGPGSVVHTVLALGAAGVYVGDGFLDVVSNAGLSEILDGPNSGQSTDTEHEAAAPQLAATIQRRRATSSAGGSAAEPVQAAIQAGGRPLPAQVRADLERRFGGVSFANVRIHTDGRAARAAEAVQAEAFTVGQQIWFSRGAFSPETRTGLHLLTHELTHVLQNRSSEMLAGGTTVGGVAVSTPTDTREREAEAVAHEVSRVEAAPEQDGAGDALSQLASRWSLELATLCEDPVSTEGTGSEVVSSSGRASADMAAELQRKPGPEDGKKDEKEATIKVLEDGTEIEVQSDGKDGFYLAGPDGQRIPCDEAGTPLSGAEELAAAGTRDQAETEARSEEEEEEEASESEEVCEEEVVEEESAEEEAAAEGEDTALEELQAGPSGDASTSAGPTGLDTLLGQGLAQYAHEKSWHESWAESGRAEGGLDTMSGGDNLNLALTALGSGAAEGLVNGVQALVIDTILNKATKRIPYAGGFIGAFEILKNPGAWWEGSFARPFGELGELWAGDWIDKLEAVVNVLDMANTVISTLSTLCLVVAGAGFFVSLFFPPLMPFVALAAKWGLLLGSISSTAGILIDLVRAGLIVARTAQIALGDADPDVQAKRAERLQMQTSKWVTSTATRAGDRLSRKPDNKSDGADTPSSGSTRKGAGGPEASSTRKSWRSRANDALNPVQQLKSQKRSLLGGADADGKPTKGLLQETRDMTAAYRDTKGQGVSDRLTAMQQGGGDGAVMSERSMERARAYDQTTQSKKSGGSSSTTPKTTPTAHKKDPGIDPTKLDPVDVRQQATSPDFWDPKNTATRKSMRRQIQKRAKRETNPQKKAALNKLADDMMYNERLLKEHLTGKKHGVGETDAVARVTQEDPLSKYKTAGPRGIQNVAKASDVSGVTSATEMTDKLGFTQDYVQDTRAKNDNFVVVIYRPDGTPIRADGAGMAQLVDTHGSDAIAYNNKTKGASDSPELFGQNTTEIQKNVVLATNTPLEPEKGGSPHLYGDSQVQTQKRVLETLLGANEQKTTDGNTLTEQGHQARMENVSDYEKRRSKAKSKANRGKNKKKGQKKAATRKRNNASDQLIPAGQDARRKYGETGGDSVPEYYDDVTNQTSSAITDGATPLNHNTAKSLDQYTHMPLVIRLDWDSGTTPGGAGSTPSTGHTDQTSQALMDRSRNFSHPHKDGHTEEEGTDTDTPLQHGFAEYMQQGLSDYSDAVLRPSLMSTGGGLLDGYTDTTSDFFTTNNLDGSDAVNGYGHKGKGTKGGAALFDSVFSSGAVDEEGNAVMETGKDGQTAQKRVSHKDRLLGLTGIAGQDASGSSQFGSQLAEMQQQEAAELDARLAEFELDYVSATGDLTPPPVQQEKVLHDAAVDWQLYDAEVQSLQSRVSEVAPLRAEADQSQQLLDAERAAVEQMTPQIDAHKTELDEKKVSQDDAGAKQDALKSEGSALNEQASQVLGPISGFVGPFKQMAGMIPSKLSSSGASAAGGADSLQSGFGDASAAGSNTMAAADTGKTMVAEMKAQTEGATGTTSQAESDMATVQASVDHEIAQTGQGQAELDQAEADAQNRISMLEAQKAAEEQKHAAAEGTMSSWASTHYSDRTGHKADGDDRMSEIESAVDALQRQSDAGGPTGVAYASLAGPMPTDASASLDSGVLSGGFALPGEVQHRMESAFGQDFSAVRLHTGALAGEAAAGFNAEAFNFGSHIIFGSGQYRPGTPDGDSLLAHELTHVVQQPSHTVARGTAGVRLERPGSHLEKEASRVASVMKSASPSSLEGIAKQAMRGAKPKG